MMNTTLMFLLVFAIGCIAAAWHFMVHKDLRIAIGGGILILLLSVGGFYGGAAIRCRRSP